MQTGPLADLTFLNPTQALAHSESEREMGRVIKEMGWNRDQLVVSQGLSTN